jgi:hypothetical protein
MEKFFLDKNQAVLVIIDVQEKLCRAMDEKVLERLTGSIGVLQEAARELGIPVVVTEQYVKGLGETLPAIREKLTEPRLENDLQPPATAASWTNRSLKRPGHRRHGGPPACSRPSRTAGSGYNVHLVRCGHERARELVRRSGGQGSLRWSSTETVSFNSLGGGDRGIQELSKLVR